jgi:uncharacterized protein (DUF362 family)
MQFLISRFETMLAALGGLGTLEDKRVLLKPNLLSAGLGPLPCTEASFILAVAHLFVAGKAVVCIGDSPAFGSARSVLARLGILQELLSLGVTVSDFRQTREVQLPSGIQARVACRALDCDLLVNMPRIKAHAQTRVTLAVKNCFGCLTGLQKPFWHMIHGGRHGLFARLLVELPQVLPPVLTLVDGIRVMHCTGPMQGRPYPLKIVAAGWNPVAVDMALLRVLGVEWADSPLHRTARKLKLPGSHCKEIHFPLAHPLSLAVDDFRVPARLAPIRFRPFSFLYSSLKRTLLSLADRE